MKFLVLVFSLLSSVFGALVLPDDIPKCAVGDSKCLAKAIGDVLKRFPTGHKLLGLPSVHPLRIDAIQIDEDPTRPININLKFKNIDNYGLNKAVISKIVGFDRNFVKPPIYEIVFQLPQYTMLSDYEINGRVIVLAINGKGRSNITLDNVQLTARFEPAFTMKNGKHFLQIGDKFKLKINETNAHIYFENLFNGNKALGENMNVFLNENWRIILDEMIPTFAEGLKKVMKVYVNRIFSKLPYEDVWSSW